MSQVMDPGPARRRPWGEPGQAHQAVERVVDVAVEQPGPGRGDEERRRAGGRGEPVAEPLVAPQRVDGGGVQGQLAGLVELAVADQQPPGGRGRCRRGRARSPRPTRIPVTASSPISVANVARRSGVRSDAAAAISAAMSASEYKYGAGPLRPLRQQVRGGHLVRRVQGVQVGGEPADHREPVGPPVRAAAGGQPRPVQRGFDGDDVLRRWRSRWSRNWLRASPAGPAGSPARGAARGSRPAPRAAARSRRAAVLVDRPGPGQHGQARPGRPWRRSRWSTATGAAAPGRPRPAGCRPAASRSRRCAAAGGRGLAQPGALRRQSKTTSSPRRWSTPDAAHGRGRTRCGPAAVAGRPRRR